MTTTKSFAVDTDQGGNYPEWLYSYATVQQEGVAGLERVTDADVARFHEQGYLLIRNAFTQEEVADGLQGLLDLIAGKRTDFTGLQFESVVADRIDELTLAERQDAVRKLMWFVNYDERLRALAAHPKLLAVLRRIIGSDDLTMFQDMGLIKPPRIGREKPWHQDMAYFNVPIDTTIAGVWLAFDPVDVDNGCMMMQPGSHRQGPHVHFRRRDWQICDADVARDAAVAIPMQPGDALIFHGLIHHGTPANRTDRRRRAVQYHYRPFFASTEDMGQEYRLSFFGSEGKDVEC